MLGHGEKLGHCARLSLQLLSGQSTGVSGGQTEPVGHSLRLKTHAPSGHRMEPVVVSNPDFGQAESSRSLSGHGSVFVEALKNRQEPSQHLTSPYWHEMDFGHSPSDGAQEPMGQRTWPAVQAVPVFVSTAGHLSMDSLQLPSMHLTGHLVEQRVSCGQSSNDATQAPVGQRMGDRAGQDTAG